MPGSAPRAGFVACHEVQGWFDCLMTEIFSRWGEHGPRPAPLEANADLFGSLVVQESVEVDCTPRAAWQLVIDIGRIGEFSPECVAAEWLGRDRQARVGARFEGTNRLSDGEDTATWVRPCTVTAADPDCRFAYVVGDRYDGTPASEWEFTLHQRADGRCQISQTFRHMQDGLSGLRHFADADPDRAAEIVAERIADLAGGMRATLHRMKAALEDGGSKDL